MSHVRIIFVLVALTALSTSSYGMYNKKAGRFLQHDPRGYGDGLSLYEYAGANPVTRSDPFGLDFIAIASRRAVPFAEEGHYSVQRWRCCGDFRPLHHSAGFSESEIVTRCGGPQRAEKTDWFELKVLDDYKVWGYHDSVPGHDYPGFPGSGIPIGAGWNVLNVWIGEIRYSDSINNPEQEAGTEIMPVISGHPFVIDFLFDSYRARAEQYSYAEQYEQAPRTTFPNWPMSLYRTFGTNSNTFVRWVMGPTMTEMTCRSHPGDTWPQQNQLEFVGGVLWQFFPAHTPWRNDQSTPPMPTGTP